MDIKQMYFADVCCICGVNVSPVVEEWRMCSSCFSKTGQIRGTCADLAELD